MGGQQSSLGQLFTSSSHHVVMLGLDCAGKSTVLYQLKLSQYMNTVPTIGFNCEKVKGRVGKSKGVSFTVWDIGGQDKIRPLWNTYIHHTEGIMFVIDSSDSERIEEARTELVKISKNVETFGVPIAIIANKQDLPGARTCPELIDIMALNDLSQHHPWTIVPAIALLGDGLHESLGALYDLMLSVKKADKTKLKKKKSH